MATKKTLYHGELRQMGPVQVTVVTEALESTFKKGTFYVTLNVAGADRHYHPENQACLDFWNGAKGKTFTVVALGGGKGKEDSATLTYVGDAEGGQAAPPARAAAAPAPASAPRRGPAPHNTAVPAGHPQHQPAAAPRAAAPAAKPAAAPHQQAGQRVGMAINQAVQYGIALQEEWNPQAIMERASDLIRISEVLESGKLCPKFSERVNQPQ